MKIMEEAKRVLVYGGDFLIKLPDFDKALEEYKNRNPEFFDLWNISDSILELWRHHGVEDTLANRASMIFCGFWNEAYGDHFSNQYRISKDAYHGPAMIDAEQLDVLLTESTPHEISKVLKQHVLANNSSDNITFNHQNAWSRNELVALFRNHGFEVTSRCEQTIFSMFYDVPTLRDAEEVSMYLSFKKIS